jgi:hypothetical protein
MAEIRTVVDHITTQYTGVFNVKDLYDTFKTWIADKDYTNKEMQNFEAVKEKGKEIYIKCEPYKEATDYAKFVIRIQFDLRDVVPVEIEKDGVKKAMHKGTAVIILDGYLITDYENRWEQKPSYVFIRTLYDKFFFKINTSNYSSVIKQDTEDLLNTLKSFLNLYKY